MCVGKSTPASGALRKEPVGGLTGGVAGSVRRGGVGAGDGVDVCVVAGARGGVCACGDGRLGWKNGNFIGRAFVLATAVPHTSFYALACSNERKISNMQPTTRYR